MEEFDINWELNKVNNNEVQEIFDEITGGVMATFPNKNIVNIGGIAGIGLLGPVFGVKGKPGPTGCIGNPGKKGISVNSYNITEKEDEEMELENKQILAEYYSNLFLNKSLQEIIDITLIEAEDFLKHLSKLTNDFLYTTEKKGLCCLKIESLYMCESGIYEDVEGIDLYKLYNCSKRNDEHIINFFERVAYNLVCNSNLNIQNVIYNYLLDKIANEEKKIMMDELNIQAEQPIKKRRI